ncbi:unnamed protein product [Spirodela intermedia]|uniref:Uncharacterized protein n=1 Tax=Spirodela intermedia TaxID=51605 RepID=A0A7I8LB23_SPIIN|nr:unnamed protein product [Spirodela intermedia]
MLPLLWSIPPKLSSDHIRHRSPPPPSSASSISNRNMKLACPNSGAAVGGAAAPAAAATSMGSLLNSQLWTSHETCTFPPPSTATFSFPLNFHRSRFTWITFFPSTATHSFASFSPAAALPPRSIRISLSFPPKLALASASMSPAARNISPLTTTATKNPLEGSGPPPAGKRARVKSHENSTPWLWNPFEPRRFQRSHGRRRNRKEAAAPPPAAATARRSSTRRESPRTVRDQVSAASPSGVS